MCEYCHRTIWRQSRFLPRNEARGLQLTANHVCHEKECDRLQKSRRPDTVAIVEGGESKELEASDRPNPRSNKRRCRLVQLGILILGVVATAVVLGVLLSKGSGNDDGGRVTQSPSSAPSPFANDATPVPSGSPDQGSTLSPVESNSTIQSICEMKDAGVPSVYADVGQELVDTQKECEDFPCVIAVNDVPSYKKLVDACKAAGGVFHVFTVEVKCSVLTIQYDNLPACWKSPDVNSACTADAAEGVINSLLDIPACVEVVSHINTTDFSASIDHSCRIESSAVVTARDDLDAELAPDVKACTSNPCVLNAESYQEFNALLDACELAGGSFHVFSVVLTCSNVTYELSDYPECLVSEEKNSNCTDDFSETYIEALWDDDGCTENATHISKTDFS
jgi:hypothetical protein